MTNETNKLTILGYVVSGLMVVLIAMLGVTLFAPGFGHSYYMMHDIPYEQGSMDEMHHAMMHTDEIVGMRDNFISQRNAIWSAQLTEGKYSCCLKKPCSYCIEKTPGHGEGASCECLDDVMNGRHPCGECIGEILEGHGNPYISKYFARAIAEEVGEQYHEPLTRIIQDKYGTPVSEQK